MASDSIKTRILIISDTHGVKPYAKLPNDPDTEDELSAADVKRVPTGYRLPLPEADVVLHCGDLTKSSMPQEYANTFAMLRAIAAPLKLVIAGNHDMALDARFWRDEARGDDEWPSAARKIIEEARVDGVQYLTEGTHTFTLDNGARLRVYASQYTPEYGGWAFQYPGGHEFDIPDDVDVAMTHGPPEAVLDYAGMSGTNAGCEDLFESIYRARPRIHCFGHIHEAWGAYHAQWKADADDKQPASRKTTIDEDSSRMIKRLPGLRPNKVIDDEQAMARKREEVIALSKQRGVVVDLTQGDNRLVKGEQTLFVNAAIMDIKYQPIQLPWLINIDLPKI